MRGILRAFEFCYGAIIIAYGNKRCIVRICVAFATARSENKE